MASFDRFERTEKYARPDKEEDDGRTEAKEDPRLPGFIYFNCPNCRVEFAVIPQFRSIQIQSDIKTILVEFKESRVGHLCERYL